MSSTSISLYKLVVEDALQQCLPKCGTDSMGCKKKSNGDGNLNKK